VDCGIGLFLALIGAATFISILWSVGGSLPVTIGSTTITIPAYMVLAALAYGILASTLMLRVGRPLIGSVVTKNEAEGHFRFALMRVRDNAESIALSRGAVDEKQLAGSLYDTLVSRWLAIVRQHGNLTWITNASGPLIPIFPLLVATPKYLSGTLSLGEVMQLAAAFVQVQVAISWIVDNYNKIADWYASARRIIELTDAAQAIDERFAVPENVAPRLTLSPSADGSLRLSDLTITDGQGNPLVAHVDLIARPGDHLVVSAPSGGGKTSIVRAIAGLWPWGQGRIELPRNSTLLVIPQRPYVPATSLRAALNYPTGTKTVDEAHYGVSLRRVGLAALASRLDETVRWDHALSNGELQRLAIARILVQRPDIVILDEALSAIDESSRRDLMQAISDALPKATVISFTQAPPVDPVSTIHIDLAESRKVLAPTLTAPGRVAVPA
ncbi:MAG: ATP-binding cassette domain-containing protein, partial [Hyphomicrobiaceae bacterium]